MLNTSYREYKTMESEQERQKPTNTSSHTHCAAGGYLTEKNAQPEMNYCSFNWE
jgi:hypothetical protein